ncbi:MAG TPA: hypothetical protein VFR95_07365 [Gemmatimonadaceae bacterium]|nr:hypothetical protein [Gemmatimonadaceae bacterium]
MSKEQGTLDTATSTGAVTNPADTTTAETDTSSVPGAPSTDTTRSMDTTVTDTATGNVTTGVPTDTTTRQGITGINDTTVTGDTTMRDTSMTDTSTTMMTDTMTTDTSTTMTDTSTTMTDTSTTMTDTTDTTAMPTDTGAVQTDTSTGEVSTQQGPDTVGMYPSRPGSGRLGRGFWIGVGGGATVPVGDLHDGGYDTGWNITVPIGWQSASTPWGLRLDLSYDRLNGSTIASAPVSVTLSDANVWSGSLDLTLQFPFGSSGSSLYLMGGGGVHHFTNIGSDNGAAVIGGNPLSSGGDNSLTKGSVNGGAGLNFGFGRAKLFLESRFVSVFTEGKNSNYVPIILGVRVF